MTIEDKINLPQMPASYFLIAWEMKPLHI